MQCCECPWGTPVHHYPLTESALNLLPLKFLNSFKHFQTLIEQRVAQHIVSFMNMNDPLSPILFTALRLFALEEGMQRSINRRLKHTSMDAVTCVMWFWRNETNNTHNSKRRKDWNSPWSWTKMKGKIPNKGCPQQVQEKIWVKIVVC